MTANQIIENRYTIFSTKVLASVLKYSGYNFTLDLAALFCADMEQTFSEQEKRSFLVLYTMAAAASTSQKGFLVFDPIREELKRRGAI